MSDLLDGYFTCNRRGTYGFRWDEFGKPGKWLVTAHGGCEGFYTVAMFDAVVDDFGNLVKVGKR